MGTEREFDALASEAIASSEKEIFNEATGQGDPVVDESGDRSLEEMGKGLEGQHDSDDDDGTEDDAPQPEVKAEGEDKGDGKDRDENGRFKAGQENDPGKSKPMSPVEYGKHKEMLAERERRQSAESELATTKSQIEVMNQRFAALEARLAQAPQPQPKPQDQQEPKADEVPDRWLDPDGYDRYQRDQILKEVRAETQTQEQRRISWSFEDAKAKHGDAFKEAYEAADSLPANDPVAKQIVTAIMQSPNPGERLVAWHNSQKAAREIGDPVAYREKAKAEAREALMKDPEFRKQVLENLQGEARNGDGGPRTSTRLPPSLSSAQGGRLSRQESGGSSDGELFEQVMG